MLTRLHEHAIEEQKHFLQHSTTGYGRALTGDGATILGTKFINFLVHEFGKGVMLMVITDCTKRLSEVGKIDSPFIAHEMLIAIKFVILFVSICLCTYVCHT